VTLVVVGASGHLGGEVCRRAVAGGWRVVGTYHRAAGVVDGVDWRRLDVRDPLAVRALVHRVRPRAVVSASYLYGDWAVTADGAAYVAMAAADVGARLVHLSSDAVHRGRPEPYLDDEPPSPVYPYGAAKAAAETAVRLVHPAAAVLRCSLIVGDAHSKQVRLCLDALSGVPGVAVFRDLIRCPVSVVDLAEAVLELLGSEFAGPLNLGGPEAVDRAELAGLVARHYRLDPAGLRISSTVEAGLPVPAEVRLDSTRAGELLRTRLRGVSELFPAN
jgi:dTDP-4-dehydrorhamnose reductase